MLMMLVMSVSVAMDHRMVPVRVIMAFGGMKPDPDRHEHRRYPEQRVRPLRENQHGQPCRLLLLLLSQTLCEDVLENLKWLFHDTFDSHPLL